MSDRIPTTGQPGTPPGADSGSTTPKVGERAGSQSAGVADTLQGAREKVREAGGDIRKGFQEAKAQAGDVAETVRSEAGDVAETVKSEVGDAASAVAERAESLADQQKTAGAEHADGIGRALERAAEELEEGSPQIAVYAREAAQSVQGIAEAMRNRTPRQLMHDVTDLARRQPLGFFGVSVMAGFAIARFARSGRPEGGDRPNNDGRHHGATDREGVHAGSPAPHGGVPAPGWVASKDATGTTYKPATMAAASLGGAVAHRQPGASPAPLPAPDSGGH